MRKLSGTIQRRNDQQVGLLGADLHTASLPAGEDHYPDGDRRGLGTRAINRLGAGIYTDHFRSGVIPVGFAWQGAPFGGAPGTLNYSAAYEYLAVATAGATRHFLSVPITNAAGAWQNNSVSARCAGGNNASAGLRVDDGTDNNYAEIYLDATAVNATQTLTFRYRSGGGITVNASGLVAPLSELYVLQLQCVFSGGNYTLYGYLVNEAGGLLTVTGFNTGVVAWAPAAGRAGYILTGAGASEPALADWLLVTFT